MGGAHVPLIASYWLCKKPGKRVWVEPDVDRKARTWRFRVIASSSPPSGEAVSEGTKIGRGDFRCLLSDAPMSAAYVREQGRANGIGYRMLAVIADAGRGRVYLSATPEQEEVARVPPPEDVPTTSLPSQALGFRVQNYGYTTHASLFTPRQLVALDTLSSLVSEAREKVLADARAAGRKEGSRLQEGGTGALAYADAVAVGLGLAVSRRHDRWTAFSIWHTIGEKLESLIRLSAVPMTWEFAEGNPFSESTGNFYDGVELTAKAIEPLGQGTPGRAEQGDARALPTDGAAVVTTDPPYFDNVPYADLSDLFYVWLRRALQPILPELLSTVLVPKADELVADPSRHSSKDAAERYFLDGMREVIARLRQRALPEVPVSIFYAFKQSESQDGGVASTGWDTFLSALVEGGFSIVGTWPIRTEQSGGLRNVGRNSLATSVVLACRARPGAAPTATRREFMTALKNELPEALAHLQRSNIAPVDLAQSAIGPGMAIYTRYSQVLDASGKPLSVREALALINQTLDEILTEQEGDFDPDTRWALAWFEQQGFSEGEFGTAETLSKAKNTSISGLVEAGILQSHRGKVRLLKPGELATSWAPATDKRLTVWEMVHHLIRVLESGGEAAAAQLAGKLGSQAEVARELAYRLYTLCERKKRASEALSYNALVQSWPEIARLARESRRPEQAELFVGGEG